MVGDLGSEIDSILAEDFYKGMSVSISISSLKEGDVVYSRNADELMVPASLAKLFTSYVALELLGADYNFTMDIYTSGEVDQGTLRGGYRIV